MAVQYGADSMVEAVSPRALNDRLGSSNAYEMVSVSLE